MQILYQLSICFTRQGYALAWLGSGQTSAQRWDFLPAVQWQCAVLQSVIWTQGETRRQKVKVNIPVLKAGTGSLSVPAVWSLSTGQPWYCWIGLYFVAWQPSVFLQWAGLSSGRLSYCQTQHQHQQRLHHRPDGGLASAWNFYWVIPVYPRCDEIRSQYKLQSFQTCW